MKFEIETNANMRILINLNLYARTFIVLNVCLRLLKSFRYFCEGVHVTKDFLQKTIRIYVLNTGK